MAKSIREKLKELAEDLKLPTFVGNDSYTLNEERKGYNRGQESAGKKLDSILREYKVMKKN